MDSTMLLYPPTQKGDIYRSNFIFFPFSFSFDVSSRKRRNLYFNADECFFFFQKRKSDTKVKCFLLTGKIYIYIYILDIGRDVKLFIGAKQPPWTRYKAIMFRIRKR